GVLIAGLGTIIGHRHPPIAGILLLVLGVFQALVFLVSLAGTVDLWWTAVVSGLLTAAVGIFVLRPRTA
ncbi:MAG TPA: hypothetical protein VN759_05705, partial [Pseudolysinimonas sp.]|nr:hypothetical protein [Pseudolysinimonas sp.]